VTEGFAVGTSGSAGRRSCGQDAVPVGSPTARRMSEELRTTVTDVDGQR
jgi:hypothetical protein